MKWSAFSLAGVVCVLVCADAAFIRDAEVPGVEKVGVQPYITGGDILGRYDHHTFVVRLKLSNNTRQSKGFKYCSGARLNNDWLLTAAECLLIPTYKFVRITSPDGYTYRHNYYEIEKDASKRVRPELIHVIHPQYKADTKKHNVALIKNDFVSTPPECWNPILPYIVDRNEYLLNTPAFVYGYTNVPGHYADDDTEIISKLRVGIVEPEACDFSFFPRPTTPRPTTTTTQKSATTKEPEPTDPPMGPVSSPLFKVDFVCIVAGQAQGLSPDDLGSPLIYQQNAFAPKKLIGIAAGVELVSGNANLILFARLNYIIDWIAEVTHIPLVPEPKQPM